MGSDSESQGSPVGLTILDMCDRLQDILINDGFDDLVVLASGEPVTRVWVEFIDGQRRVVLYGD